MISTRSILLYPFQAMNQYLFTTISTKTESELMLK